MKIWTVNRYATPPDSCGATRHHDFGQESVRQSSHIIVVASCFDPRTRREENPARYLSHRKEDVDGVDFGGHPNVQR